MVAAVVIGSCVPRGVVGDGVRDHSASARANAPPSFHWVPLCLPLRAYRPESFQFPHNLPEFRKMETEKAHQLYRDAEFDDTAGGGGGRWAVGHWALRTR